MAVTVLLHHLLYFQRQALLVYCHIYRRKRLTFLFSFLDILNSDNKVNMHDELGIFMLAKCKPTTCSSLLFSYNMDAQDGTLIWKVPCNEKFRLKGEISILKTFIISFMIYDLGWRWGRLYLRNSYRYSFCIELYFIVFSSFVLGSVFPIRKIIRICIFFFILYISVCAKKKKTEKKKGCI